MGTTTMGVKLDDATRERIKSAATRIDRTPHWLIKQAIFSYLEQLENSDTLPELPALLSGAANESDEAPTPAEEPHQPFLDFAEQILPQSVSRAAITAAYRRPETEAVSMLLEQARLPQPVAEQAHKLAYQLADKLRNQKKCQWSCRNGPGVIAGVFAVIAGRRGADVSGRSVVAYSRQSHPRRVNSRQNQQR